MEVRILPIKYDVETKDFKEFKRILVEKLDGKIDEGDVLVIASKILLRVKGLYIQLEGIEPSEDAIRLSNKYGLDPRFAELIVKYSDVVLGGVEGAILTYAGGVLTANAGLDRKNIGLGMASLPPYLLRGTAKEIYNYIKETLGFRIGVIITDSVVYPLRMGTRLYAVDIYGFDPIKDYRGVEDIYGRNILFTRLNLADEVASAAHLVMGEGRERIPAVLIKGLDIRLVEDIGADKLMISPSECLYKDLYPKDLKRL